MAACRQQSLGVHSSRTLRGGAPTWSLNLNVSLSPNTSDWRYREAHTDVMVELPMPSGTSLPDRTFHSLRRLPFVQHVELNDRGDRPVLGLFIGDLNEQRTFEVELQGTGEASLHVGGVRVLPMYQPEHAVSANTNRITVAEAEALSETRELVI